MYIDVEIINCTLWRILNIQSPWSSAHPTSKHPWEVMAAFPWGEWCQHLQGIDEDIDEDIDVDVEAMGNGPPPSRHRWRHGGNGKRLFPFPHMRKERWRAEGEWFHHLEGINEDVEGMGNGRHLPSETFLFDYKSITININSQLAQSNISVNSQQPMRRLLWKLSANQRQVS